MSKCFWHLLPLKNIRFFICINQSNFKTATSQMLVQLMIQLPEWEGFHLCSICVHVFTMNDFFNTHTEDFPIKWRVDPDVFKRKRKKGDISWSASWIFTFVCLFICSQSQATMHYKVTKYNIQKNMLKSGAKWGLRDQYKKLGTIPYL